ncbi:NAD(P)/FAD-dependent oxidoreductase [Hornefia butyriciproducens]|uniref:NAD(P)/FAD-dependent oxidoreductase n=1 Tax=Hornefia butyriciproducens TaxID=2652293 RepID=UPI002A911FA4|nr:NAD(FAD)-utilizing dehydrogenase [Hornefia butyriciproducens]MDY5463512.1 NAD(FAD)-utilizing dehydrogenase [Hornefia butyriciproducens]
MKVKRYRLTQLKLRLDESPNVIPAKIAKKFGYRDMQISDLTIVRKSVDARKKSDIRQVFTVDFTTDRELDLPVPKDISYQSVPSGTEPMKHRPVIVGLGPCGIFCGMTLAERGYRPVIVERGYDMDTRIKVVNDFWERGIFNPECNVQYGEGGAGTFSDGKLTTGIRDPRRFKVLEEFIEAGADPEIRYVQKPHVGTDILRHIVRNMRYKIENMGGDVEFDARMNRITTEGDRLTGLVIQQGYQLRHIDADNLILAMGHSSRDTLRSLLKSGLHMEQKPFSIGVRIEHPQQMVDESQYGSEAGNPYLPHATYKLVHHCENGRGVYTFCMCPGGEVIVASSETGRVVTNGMSYRQRNSGVANSGLLVDVRTSDFGSNHPLSGMEFQEKYEEIAFHNGGGNYKAPQTTWADFRDNTAAAQPVIESLPDFAVDAIREAMPHLGQKLKGFDADDARMTAVETRSSSPVRILRDEHFESNIKGLFPGGEGAGYAGGIMSSAVDGIRLAEEIIRRYAPME